MNRARARLVTAVANLLAFLGVLTVNGLANTLPINNMTTGELSDQYPNLFVPAGLTFSVWGVIYILLATFIFYGLKSAIRQDTSADFIDKTGIWFVMSCIANIGWVFAWHYEAVTLSLIIMLVLLGCLLAMYLRLNIGKRDSPKKEKYYVHLPLSVYLGWITIATIANVTAFLVDINWDRFGISDQFWTVLVIAVGIAITLGVLIRRQDIYYAAVVDWALLGILIRRLLDTIPAQPVITVTASGIFIVTTIMIIQIIRKKVYSFGR